MDQLTGPIRPTLLVRLAVPIAILGGCMWIVLDMIDTSTLTALPAMLMAQSSEVLLTCAALCALSFWAVARYDGVAHRHFRTDTHPSHARQSGFAAIALAQTLGFGIFTGAAARWRVLPGLSFLQALRLSTFVAMTFMPALLFLTALSCLVLLPYGWWTVPAILGTIAFPVLCAALSFAPACAGLRNRGHIPSLRAITAILGWVALDVLAAALAFYVLIPTANLQFLTILPVFLLALSGAMLSGAPGGVGPFEIVMLTLLPHIPVADLLVAIVCFRALYYAVPALLAVRYLLRPLPPKATAPRAPRPYTGTSPAEMGIMAQNGGRIVAQGTGGLAVLPTPQTLSQFFDPIDLPVETALTFLSQAAAQDNRIPLVYKCAARTAVQARDMRWAVWRIAHDALIDVGSHDLALPSRRRLRRALRKADGAGVRTLHAAGLPIAQMAQLDCAWQDSHGRAQGTTMGRFCPAYLTGQDVFLAYQGTALIAFASFHRNADTLCLDLMRHGSDLPTGTMHALVQAAVDWARSQGLRTVSLAAIPDLPSALLQLPGLRRRFDRAGLTQFKNAFAPRWVPRYAAAPSRAALCLGLADMMLAVNAPPDLSNTRPAHNQDEDYEFAYSWPS